MAIITSTECTLPRPDIGALHDQLATEMSRRLLGGAPVLPMSAEDVLSFVMAGAVNLMFGAVSQALKENDPASMCCDNLVVYGAKHGIDLQASTRSKGYVAITGTPLAPIPSNIRFVGASSREYKLDPAVTTNPGTLDASGAASLRIVATTAGAVFDLPAGAELAVSTTIPGIDLEATVVGNGLTGGTSDESCDSLRRRVTAAESAMAISTNEAWYMRQAANYPGVTRVCTDECLGCCDPSNFSLYPFMEGVYGDYATAPYGVPPAGVIDEMTEWMFGKQPGKGQGLAPVGQRGAFRCAIPTVVDIVGHCASGCKDAMENQITAALQLYFRAVYCVGSTICKDQVRTAAYTALGQDPCFSELELVFDDSLHFEDAANAYLECGHFLVLGSVTLTEFE
jgi:baseplate J-like protein